MSINIDKHFLKSIANGFY